MEYRVVSLYSGCSGSDKGFISEGFTIRLAVEINGACCDTYKQNLGVRPLQTPVGNIGEIPEAEIIIGGPPCQSFSNARSSGYENGYRSATGITEIRNFASIVEENLPPLFIMENAPTLLQTSMSAILREILSLFPSYTVALYVLNSEDYGVPQQRERAFFLGALKSTGINFLPPVRNHWRKHYSGWADYLGLPPEGVLIRRGSAVKYKTIFEPSYTITCADLPCIRYSASKISGTMASNERVLTHQRALTIRELALLQGFTDYTFLGNSSEQRDMIGNAWTVNVARALATRAKEILNGIKS